MSSALAAFAKQADAQQRACPDPAPREADDAADDDDAYASDQDDQRASQERVLASTTVTPPGTSALAAFAHARQPAKTKAVTLVDVALEQPPLTQRPPHGPPTLADVARTFDEPPLPQQNDRAAGRQLAAIAAAVESEERAAAQLRARGIERALTTTSQQVQRDHAAQRHAQVTLALREAQEDAYNQQDDAFEAAEDAAVARAAARVVASTSDASKWQPGQRGLQRTTTLSVDRHLLKQRAPRRGLDCRSTTKVATLKDKLSAFQFDQLSLAQQRVFRAMLVDDNDVAETKKAKQPRCNTHVIEALAKDRATQQRERHRLLKTKPPAFAKLDDARHCRFKPKTKAVGSGRSANRDDDDGEDDDDGGSGQRREDFIRRMEATERVRTETLRRTRAERDYLAQLDKKECPQCGNPQSYAELTQKRRKCPNCGVAYKSRLAWGEIADAFLARMDAHLQARRARDNQRDHEHDHGDDHDDDDGEREPRPRAEARRWCDVRDAFLGRVQLDLQQRALTKELILRELEAQCTFAPQISARARRLRLGDFDERLRRDLENRRVRQEQYRLLSAAMARAEAGGGSKRGGGARTTTTPRHGLPRSFAQRLEQDVHQRRERRAANDNPKLVQRSMTGSSGRSRY